MTKTNAVVVSDVIEKLFPVREFIRLDIDNILETVFVLH